MKRFAFAVPVLAATTLSLLALVTGAAPARAGDYTVNLGTLNVTAANFNSLPVTGVPANTPGLTWSQFSVNFDWAAVSGNSYSTETRIAFSADPATGASTVSPTGAGAYTGALTPTTGGLSSGAPTTLGFTGSLATPYASGSPLNFWYRQTFGGSVATWTNVSITLKEAATSSVAGTTLGAPTWTRPNANGVLAPTGLSTTATATSFTVQPFTVSVAGNYDVLSAVGTPAWDNYTFLYSGSFDSAQPLANCLIGNDDFGSAAVSGFTKALTSGTQYYLVTTGFNNSAFGTFTKKVTGPGLASFGGVAAPEPGTFALLLPGMGALIGGVAVRRRKRNAV